jgi:hypothetical protein
MSQNSDSFPICPSQNHVFLLSENGESEDAVRESLCKLLTARYVERCPVPEVSIVVEEKNDNKKRGSKAARVIVSLCQFLEVVWLSLINPCVISEAS